MNYPRKGWVETDLEAYELRCERAQAAYDSLSDSERFVVDMHDGQCSDYEVTEIVLPDVVRNCRMVDCEMQGIWRGEVFRNVSFHRCNFAGATFIDCTFDDCGGFDSCNCEGTWFVHCNFPARYGTFDGDWRAVAFYGCYGDGFDKTLADIKEEKEWDAKHAEKVEKQ